MATPAFDAASFYSEGFFTRSPLDAAAGTYTVVGYPVTFAVDRALLAGAGQYTIGGYSVTLAHNHVISAQSGNYTVTGQAASLYNELFFYIDVEVIYVPQETNFVLVPPAVVSADETIAVPAEVQLLTLDFEDRQITVPVDDPIEELAEYRESAAEARLRTT